MARSGVRQDPENGGLGELETGSGEVCLALSGHPGLGDPRSALLRIQDACLDCVSVH